MKTLQMACNHDKLNPIAIMDVSKSKGVYPKTCGQVTKTSIYEDFLLLCLTNVVTKKKLTNIDLL